jgi:iron-sulfur cluster repair protein YtfE (RIC family)
LTHIKSATPAAADNPRTESQEPSREIVMENVTETLSAHHRACDELFLAAEGAAAEGRWPECKTKIGAYRSEMARHFDFEEQILFPAFEQATGMSHGPTTVMREEHAQMLELIERLVDAAARSHSEDYLAASETMLVLMQQHNLKEEGVLYPECDALLGSDDGVIAEGLRALGVAE